ncbi:MAG: hypothetical protein ACRD19_17560, partial [Terriglobia bacterium]
MANPQNAMGPENMNAPRAPYEERHYTVDEAAELWNLSRDVITRLFEAEAGVVVIENRRLGSRRRHRTLRIPQSVLERVHRRLSNPN